MNGRRLIYFVEKDIRGGVTIYGENGVRRYYCRSKKAVKAYLTQAKTEDIIDEWRSHHAR